MDGTYGIYYLWVVSAATEITPRNNFSCRAESVDQVSFHTCQTNQTFLVKKNALVPNDCDLSESDKHKNTGTTLVTVIWFSYILEMTSVPQINKKRM